MNNNSLSKKLNIPHMIEAFFITAVLYVVMLALCHITPFGERTWIMYDMKLQYVDFYAYARHLLEGESNLFYSFGTTLGSGTIGFFTYYITSPFVLVASLFPVDMLPLAMTIIIGLELSLASMTMDIFLQKFCGQSSYMCAVSYGFSGYIIANAMNVMWLDVYVLIPIVIYMTERLIRDGKLIGFIVSVAAILTLNYYISYMVLIFVVLWTFIRMFAIKEKNPSQVIMRLGMSIVAAAASVAILLIPAFLELKNNQITQRINAVQEVVSNVTLKQIVGKFFSLTSDSVEMYWGAPMVFSGLIILILSIMYIFDNKIDWRERVSMLLLAAVLIASFVLDRVNLLWHVGIEHADFPYREAVFLVFIMIVAACRCLQAIKIREGVSVRAYLTTVVLIAIIAVYALKDPGRRVNDWKIQYNYIMLTILVILLGAYGMVKKKLLHMLLAFLIVALQFVDLGLNGIYIYRSEAINAERADSFAEAVDRIEPSIKAMKKMDPYFYRMENWSTRGRNDGLMFGYNSVTNHSESSLTYVRDFLQRLGFDDDEDYLEYGHDNTETADSLLGIKYVLTDSSHSARMHKEYKLALDGDVQAYINPYALPIAVGVYREMSGESIDPFSLQEEIYSRLAGEMISIFQPAEVTHVTYSSSRPHVDYTVTAKKSGEMYFYMADLIDNFDNMEIYINEEFVTYYGNDACLKVLNLGYMEEGDTIYVTVRADDEDEFGQALFMTEDIGALAYAYGRVKPRFANVVKVTSSHLQLLLDSAYTVGDELGGNVGIYTSIPYEKGWSVHVAGVKVEPVEVYDSLMYIPVTEALQQVELAPGENVTVDMVYIPEGFIFSAGVSLITIITMMLIAALRKSEAGYFTYDEEEESEFLGEK